MKKFRNLKVLLVANDSLFMTKDNFKSGLYPEIFKIFNSLFANTKICFCNELKSFEDKEIYNLKKSFSFTKFNSRIKENFLRFIEFLFGKNLIFEKIRYHKLLKNIKYDFDLIISISSTTNSGILACLISKKLNKPYIILEHMTHYQRDNISIWQKKLLRYVQRSATLVAPVSEPLQLSLKKFNPAIKTEVVYNPISDEMFGNPSSRLTMHLKEFSKGSYCFGAWTVWRDIKRLDLLLDAFKDLRLKFKHPCKLIVGGKSVNDDLISRMKHDKDIMFLGPLRRDEIHALSAFIDCCVIPSDHETFGLPIAEAMSQGKPVISTNCGGVENLIDKSLGFVIKKDNKESLVNAMNLIIKKNDFSNEKIKQFANKHFSSFEIKERWSNILSNLLLEKNDKTSSL